MKRIALVTGANRGLGLETARQLLDRSYRVVLAARDVTKGKRTAQDVGSLGNVHFHRLDVTRPESVAEIQTFVTATFGRMDVLANNAGVLLNEEDGDEVVMENR